MWPAEHSSLVRERGVGPYVHCIEDPDLWDRRRERSSDHNRLSSKCGAVFLTLHRHPLDEPRWPRIACIGAKSLRMLRDRRPQAAYDARCQPRKLLALADPSRGA